MTTTPTFPHDFQNSTPSSSASGAVSASDLRALPWRAVGGVLCALGVLLLVAAQWVNWGPLLRFGVFGGLVLVTGAVLVRTLRLGDVGGAARDGSQALLVDGLGLAHAVSLGLFLVIHGQTFQSGAGSETLLLVWTLLVLPWAVLLRGPLTMLLTWALGLTAAFLWVLQGEWSPSVMAVVAGLWCALWRVTLFMLEAHPSLFPKGNEGVLLGRRWQALSGVITAAGVMLTAGWSSFVLFVQPVWSTLAEGWTFACAALFFLFTVKSLPNLHGGKGAAISASAGNDPLHAELRCRNAKLARTVWVAGAWMGANGLLGFSGLHALSNVEVYLVVGILINLAAIAVLGGAVKGFVFAEERTDASDKSAVPQEGGAFRTFLQVLAGLAVAGFGIGLTEVVWELDPQGSGVVYFLLPFVWRLWRVLRAKKTGERTEPTATESMLSTSALLMGLWLVTDYRPLLSTANVPAMVGLAVGAVFLRIRWLWAGVMLLAPWALMREFGGEWGGGESGSILFWTARANILLAALTIAWGFVGRHRVRRDRAEGLVAPLLTGALLSALMIQTHTVSGAFLWDVPGTPITAKPDILAGAVVVLAWAWARRMKEKAEDVRLAVWRFPSAALVLLLGVVLLPEASVIVLVVGAAALGFDRGETPWSRLTAAVLVAMGLHATLVWGMHGSSLGLTGIHFLANGAILLVAAGLAYGFRERKTPESSLQCSATNGADLSVPQRSVRLQSKRAAVLLALIAAVLAAGVVRDAVHLQSARTVWAELRPVDPRDILMGDFMALAYDVDGTQETKEGYVVMVKDGLLVPVAADAGADDGKTASHERLYLAADTFLMEPRLPRRFFFPQGEAELWGAMHYAELACTGGESADDPARCLLVRLTAAPGEAAKK